METKKDRLDAGLAGHNHYKIRLPGWRYQFRQWLLPVVRWETPYVAYLQEKLRSQTLDAYFAMIANLGTHTAFMVMLPILFWCGYMDMARGMVHILAAGVFLSGFVKDLLCLPRPLSPPLTRITMSGSAALEYGFPSTHSTNAVSVAYYALHILKQGPSENPQNTNIFWQTLLYVYVVSIVLGRLYCGMHGFFDVILGSALGALIGAIQSEYGPAFDEWLYPSPASNIWLLAIGILIAVRIHPEPADDCPCFDDSVAFAGVMIGCEYASWHFAKTTAAWTSPINIPFDLQRLGLAIATVRVVIGILFVFVWRATMKPFLLKVLPPIFRVIESLGLDSPRRFFIRASEYKSVPRQRNDDNVIPSAREIPKMLSNLRRKRAISIGPQSEADARETIAYREQQQRDSMSIPLIITPINEGRAQDSYFNSSHGASQRTGSHTRKRSSSIEEFRRQMGAGMEALSPTAVETPGLSGLPPTSNSHQLDRMGERELLAHIQKPRVRYDVEVVTKLIVYAGIAWVAIELSPRFFHHIGLSL